MLVQKNRMILWSSALSFIVAEIGVNWDGDLKILEHMIKNAKQSGCDAVKFQAFNFDIVKASPIAEELLKSSVSPSNICEIDQLSKKYNIEWFGTPMYTDAVAMLEPFVKRYKIRYGDSKKILENQPSELFDAVLRSGKEIFVSTNTTPKNCKHYKNPKIKWLYVVPKYPCGISDLDFSNFSDFDGYSNHYPHFLGPLVAATLHSKTIEVHITPDKTRDYPDNPVSFDLKELHELVQLIRKVEQIKK